MWAEILKALSVYLSSMLKFIFGPLGGKAAGLSMITTMVVTAAGMMTVVVGFVYFGKFIRERIINRFFRPRDKEPGTGRWAKFSKKYGIAGVAFLTPLILTPIGGSLLAVSIGGNSSREKILLYMMISACVWSVLLTLAVYLGYDAFMNLIGRVQPV